MDAEGSHIPTDRRPGRAATANAAGRFEPYAREALNDGWEREPLPPLRTEVTEERTRKALAANDSPDIPFDRSLNPYRGCEHGCIYCYARPTHAWLGLSPGLDFETRLIAKPGAPAALVRELGAKGYVPRPIALGTATDPYQPIERDRRITRALLEVLRSHRHPVVLATRGTLIERDLDLLAPMAAEGLVKVGVSVTTLDPSLSRAMEPRAPAPARRLQTIRRLSEAGVPVRAMVSPVIPALTDHEIEAILAAASDAGARAASLIVLRLPREIADLFRDWLDERFPDRAARVMNRVRELHGGSDYDSGWGTRMTGQGEWARLMRARFDLAARRLGLGGMPPLRTDLFRVPRAPDPQLSLF
ncbi:PA0069 family radical SAM protein [Rubellimicrobium aerolatum]|uniref:PA0069 family radical SAM protein n=1 Tax=Rubellimicrobium aerolatum TaxID=490979 RepID=A0ABW0S641_9RHOB|nr:PA0069 family radical SAM protein [Rubellimicrobium aerolatum]MBP1804501.1 DNA repair photolyase [Rubellimicrobium aerolatum]